MNNTERYVQRKREEYPVVAAFLETADTETIDLVHDALMALAANAVCPITPPVIGGLTTVGYWKRIIEDNWTSRQFLNMFIEMCDVFI